MSERRGSTLLLASVLATVASALAVPGGRGGRATQSVPPAARPEDAVFAALVAAVADGAGSEPVAVEERRGLLAALRALGRPALVSFLAAAVGESAEEAPRLAALECLEDCATAREVVVLTRFAMPGGRAPSIRLGAALRAALVETLARDPRAFGELAPAWHGAGAEVRAELVAAVAERGDPSGLEFLAWVARFGGAGLQRAVADACLRIAPCVPGVEARAHLEALCVLLKSKDAVCVQTISIALARARVEAAVPGWIELLESESGGTRARARRSLTELTGLDLGPARERWRAWHEAEAAWFEEQAPGVLAELESEDDGRVLAALRALSRQRLHRDELAEAVARLLDHVTPAVRLCACSTLESLGSPGTLERLAGMLADEDEAVARGAWSSLRRLTGLDLPLDEALWRARVADPF